MSLSGKVLGGGGGATEKLTLRLKYQRYFTKSCTHYLFNMNKTWLTVYYIKNKMEHTVIVN